MNQKQIAGVVINVDEEGYLTDHAQWTRDVAVALAQEEGVELTPADWRVLEFIDKDFREKGVVPGMRRMNKIGGIATKDLYTLFPNGPIKKAARIAGYPKPVSCVKEADMISEERIKKVSIIVSHGSLDGVYPGLIMANGARMEGIEANLFFTFFGLHAVLRQKMKHLKVATVGNPALCVPAAMGPGTPTWLGGIPGMSWIATAMMKKEMEKIDIPRVSEFIEMIHDAGRKIYACKATVDMFKLTKQELLPPGRQDSDGRGILRRVGWSPDHFHVSHLTSN